MAMRIVSDERIRRRDIVVSIPWPDLSRMLKAAACEHVGYEISVPEVAIKFLQRGSGKVDAWEAEVTLTVVAE